MNFSVRMKSPLSAWDNGEGSLRSPNATGRTRLRRLVRKLPKTRKWNEHRAMDDCLATDDAIEEVLESVERALQVIPGDDQFRPGLLTMRRGLLCRLEQPPLSAVPPR